MFSLMILFWFHEFFLLIFSAGSNEHTSKNCESKLKGADAYRFAECFVCKQTGHLAKACPDNPKGLYPKGKQIQKINMEEKNSWEE